MQELPKGGESGVNQWRQRSLIVKIMVRNFFLIENMNINEKQNRAKLIKLRKQHLIAKWQFYRSCGIQYHLHLHFYLSWKEWIASDLKTWRSWINVHDASFFFFHASEREISLSNNATLIQSELIRMFFITYDKRELCFCSLRTKDPRIWPHLSMLKHIDVHSKCLIFLCSDQCSIFVDRTPKCNCIASEVASTPVWQGIGERLPLVLCPT